MVSPVRTTSAREMLAPSQRVQYIRKRPIDRDAFIQRQGAPVLGVRLVYPKQTAGGDKGAGAHFSPWSTTTGAAAGAPSMAPFPLPFPICGEGGLLGRKARLACHRRARAVPCHSAHLSLRRSTLPLSVTSLLPAQEPPGHRARAGTRRRGTLVAPEHSFAWTLAHTFRGTFNAQEYFPEK
jgi:hypothetical protein